MQENIKSALYLCPTCGGYSAADDWNNNTEEKFGNEIYEIQDDNNRSGCWYKCPECDSVVNGEEIKPKYGND